MALTANEIQELKDLLTKDRNDVHEGILRVYLRGVGGDLQNRIVARVKELLNKL